jgi:hypothetical protein
MPSMTRQWGERSFAALRMTLRKKNADLYRSADKKDVTWGSFHGLLHRFGDRASQNC